MLNWNGKACNRLHWVRHDFIWPPDENNAEEMEVYNRRMRWQDSAGGRHVGR